MADMAAIAVAAMALLAATVVAQPSLVSEQTFNDMLKHRDDSICPAHGFYTYAAFIAATNAFPDFANSGDTDTKKRELAAFFAHSSQETTGGSATAQDGPYAWGYCFKEEINHKTDCDTSKGWTCNPNKQYYGRGPLQLTWNYNYGNAGKALKFDGINNPEIVSQDATVAFKAALWFWMTPQSPKPSCHDVITGKFTPSPADTAAGRKAGFGLTTNIINGGVECGKGSVDSQNGRIGFFQRYCTILGITPGDNLYCNSQQPYPS